MAKRAIDPCNYKNDHSEEEFPVKIKAILPDKARDRKTLDSRELMLAPAHSTDVILKVDNIKIGPDNSDTYTDEVFASPDMIRQCIKAEKEGYDSIVVYCFNDIAIDAIRENVSIPVIGPAETTLAVANTLFSRFMVITTLSENIKGLYRNLMRNSIAREKMTSVRALDIPLSKIRDNPTITQEYIIKECKKAIQEEHIDGVIFGCLSMASYGDKVEKELPIKVLDPAFISVACAEMAARLNLCHTKTTYPKYVNTNNLDLA